MIPHRCPTCDAEPKIILSWRYTVSCPCCETSGVIASGEHREAAVAAWNDSVDELRADTSIAVAQRIIDASLRESEPWREHTEADRDAGGVFS